MYLWLRAKQIGFHVAAHSAIMKGRCWFIYSLKRCVCLGLRTFVRAYLSVIMYGSLCSCMPTCQALNSQLWLARNPVHKYYNPNWSQLTWSSESLGYDINLDMYGPPQKGTMNTFYQPNPWYIDRATYHNPNLKFYSVHAAAGARCEPCTMVSITVRRTVNRGRGNNRSVLW